MKFVANLKKKSVLLFRGSNPLGASTKDIYLGLEKPYLTLEVPCYVFCKIFEV